jgi:hypothetical protein
MRPVLVWVVVYVITIFNNCCCTCVLNMYVVVVLPFYVTAKFPAAQRYQSGVFFFCVCAQL